MLKFDIFVGEVERHLKQVNAKESLGSRADIYGKSAIGDLLSQFLDTQAIDSTMVEIYATA